MIQNIQYYSVYLRQLPRTRENRFFSKNRDNMVLKRQNMRSSQHVYLSCKLQRLGMPRSLLGLGLQGVELGHGAHKLLVSSLLDHFVDNVLRCAQTPLLISLSIKLIALVTLLHVTLHSSLHCQLPQIILHYIPARSSLLSRACTLSGGIGRHLGAVPPASTCSN